MYVAYLLVGMSWSQRVMLAHKTRNHGWRNIPQDGLGFLCILFLAAVTIMVLWPLHVFITFASDQLNPGQPGW